MCATALGAKRADPAACDRLLLARGVWLTTARYGSIVRRSPRWWCPPPLGRLLLARLVANAGRFAAYLPVPLLTWDDRHRALRQPFVPGARPIRQLAMDDGRLPQVVGALTAFWAAAEECWRRAGWLPDIGGRVYLPWELYNPLRTDNVVVDAGGRCWLVDPGATALFHSRRSPLGRLHSGLMLRAIRRQAERMRRDLEEPA